MDELLDTRSLAEKLGLRPQTLRKMRLDGRGPEFVRLGPATVRYTASSVREWLAAHTRKSTAGERGGSLR